MTRSWQMLRKANQHLKAAKVASEALIALHEIRFIERYPNSSYEADVAEDTEKLNETRNFLSSLDAFLTTSIKKREAILFNREDDYSFRSIVEGLKDRYVTAEERDLLEVVKEAEKQLETFINHPETIANTDELERLLEALADTSMEKHERAMMLAAADYVR